MDFTNAFTVNVPLEHVWEFMLDAERVTPCVAGAAITEVIDPTHYKGTVKMKLGAVQMTYRGDLEMEPDEAARTITLRAKGTDVRGGGGATGTVTTRLTTDGTLTTIQMDSHVDVTGRVAQFGRGIMQDVANRMVKDFARCIEAHLIAGNEPEAEESEAISPQSVEDSALQTATAAAASMPAETVASSSQTGTGAPAQASATEPESATTVVEAPIQEPSPAPAPIPSRPQVPPPQRSRPTPPTAATEIRPMDLLIAVLRARLAVLLRFIADRIEPRD